MVVSQQSRQGEVKKPIIMLPFALRSIIAISHEMMRQAPLPSGIEVERRASFPMYRGLS